MIKKHIGKEIEGLEINGIPAPYPILNERAIRATAGLMFAIGLSTMWYTVLTQDRSIMQRVVPVYALHFLIVVCWGPCYSPLAWVGQWLTKGQTPDYVGAIQKRFARGIGLMMATAMMLSVFVFHAPREVLLGICGTCLFFMWLESAAGICVGCKIYWWLVGKGFLAEPEHAPACPGGACPMPQRKVDK